MIKDIQELNFPSYATLSQATVSLNDMGDRTISAQVKIDGAITPDFSYDWEVEFQGERYIQPLREPQASKGNESICSTIDLVFQHKTIYDLKRYFFPKMAEVESGTTSAESYIADLSVNLGQFCVALQDVLSYYYRIGYLDEPITVNLNQDWQYDEEPQYIQIQYTHIWDVLQKVYEVFGVRWTIEGQTIRIGYPAEAVEHLFEYGFEGGLLRVERQVQSTDIRNSLLGRGGEKNLPYRYFKDVDAQNPSFTADPDWIPELANIYFTELRGKTFRDYVKGWKAKHYGGEVMAEPTEAYTKGYTDEEFNPVEYVEDKESIEKYGLLQGGLENQEDIYPSIQGVEVEPYGRIDQIVGAEQVVVDDTEDSLYTPQFVDTDIEDFFSSDKIVATDVENEYILKSDTIHQSLDGHVGAFIGNPVFKTTAYVSWFDYTWHLFESRTLDTEFISATLIDAETGDELVDTVTIPEGLKFKVEYRVRIKPIELGGVLLEASVHCKSEWRLVNNPLVGVLLKNIDDDGSRISESVTIDNGSTSFVTLQTDEFEVLEDGATNVDVPINILADFSASGLYEWQRSVEAVNVDTNEVVSSINIPQGTYYLRVKVEIINNSTTAQTFTVQLMPAYVYFPIDTEEWQPTFDIWVKNIWGTTRNEGESAEAYTERVWLPILGDREGNEAKVVFTTGWLSGHSDYEFKITNVAYAGNEGVEHKGINAEWRITLAKSDAELEATGLYIPSTKQQANTGDHFFFIGIDMPHQYVLWAEEQLDNFKRDQLLETANIKPTWVVQTDKVRLNQLQEGEVEPLLNALRVGNSIRLTDSRFISGTHETLYLQSVTYSWGTDTIMLPNIEVVLSDKVATVSNPVQQIQGEINALSKQVGSLSNVQQIMRTIGDKIYLRKDGIEELCKSPIEFFKTITSRGFRQGAVGGSGWGLRTDGEKGILEVDRLVVRDDLQVNSLVSNQVTAMGGKQIESAASILCSRVDATEDGFVCYFDQKQGSVANLFQVNDIAYSQVFSPDNAQMKYYKREVIAVDANSITLSLTSDGDGMPQVGDTIVHYGNTTDTNRQYVIIRDVVGGGYERMLSGLNSITAMGTEYYFAGRIDGDTPRWFVGDKAKQYIEYKDGVLTINANVTLGATSDLSQVEQFNSVKASVDNLTNSSVFTSADLPALENEHAKVVAEYEHIIYQCDNYGIDYQFEPNYRQPAEGYINDLERAINAVKNNGSIDASGVNDSRVLYYEALELVQCAISDAIDGNIYNAQVNARPDLDYLKQVFPNAILDVNGASLAQLLGVKNTANNVEAGLYGGADEELNDSGFIDSTKGILMFFAGANSLQNIASAATRIYEDGTLETNKIVAKGGKLGVFEIDPNSGYQLKSIEDGSAMELRGKGLAFSSDNMQVVIRNNVGGNIIYPLTIANKIPNSGGGINAGIAIDVSGASGDDAMGNNIAVLIGNGDISMQSGMYRGLRPMTRVIDTSLTLSIYDNTIVCNNTTSITLTLPNNPSIGQMYVVRGINRTATNTITIQGDGQYILLNRGITDALVSSVTISTYSALELHYIGEINSQKYWIAAYQTKE